MEDPAVAVRGEKLLDKCIACHDVSNQERRIGPTLVDVVGRRAGNVPGFVYSAALARSGVYWDEKNLIRFLQAPQKFVPGTSMVITPLTEVDARQIVEYLAQSK